MDLDEIRICLMDLRINLVTELSPQIFQFRNYYETDLEFY